MALKKIKQFIKRKTSTIKWLCRHYNKKTGEPFLTNIHENTAQKLTLLCEKLTVNYRLSNWQEYVEKGHFNHKISLIGNVRHILLCSLKTLGKDAHLTLDIVIKNLSLKVAEQKHQLRRGQAKIILRQALDRLSHLFENLKG